MKRYFDDVTGRPDPAKVERSETQHNEALLIPNAVCKDYLPVRAPAFGVNPPAHIAVKTGICAGYA